MTGPLTLRQFSNPAVDGLVVRVQPRPATGQKLIRSDEAFAIGHDASLLRSCPVAEEAVQILEASARCASISLATRSSIASPIDEAALEIAAALA
jgi:hypothetical protein